MLFSKGDFNLTTIAFLCSSESFTVRVIHTPNLPKSFQHIGMGGTCFSPKRASPLTDINPSVYSLLILKCVKSMCSVFLFVVLSQDKLW